MHIPSVLRASPVSAFLLMTAVGCASGTDGGTSGEDDDGGFVQEPMDSGVDAGKPDSGVDAGRPDSGFDAGPPPAVRVDLFSDTNFTGTSTFARLGDTNDLGAFSDLTSSARVATGYVAYGFTDANLGGTISTVVTGETASLPVGENDSWTSIAVRDAAEPYVTFDTVSGGGGTRRYPLGNFPSLGANNDTFDGFTIPDGVTVLAYRNNDYDSLIGTYVGPLSTLSLPERDSWSSMRIRMTQVADDNVRASALYLNTGYGGASLVLVAGNYSTLNIHSGITQFVNSVSSVRMSPSFQMWGFSYDRFGGDAFGPHTADSVTISGDNDWDSVVITDVNAPIVTLYMNSGYGAPKPRPIVDVPNLQSLNDNVDGIQVPAGYVVFGFADSIYGGRPYRHVEGQSTTTHDDWTSYRVVPVGTPTITAYIDAGMANGVVYPIGSYSQLNSVKNAFDGVSIPAGVRVCAWSNGDFAGTRWELVGPLDLGSLGTNGQNDWDSMIVTTAASCQ